MPSRMTVQDRRVLRDFILEIGTVTEAQIEALEARREISGLKQWAVSVRDSSPFVRWTTAFKLSFVSDLNAPPPVRETAVGRLVEKTKALLGGGAEALAWVLNPTPYRIYFYDTAIRRLYHEATLNPWKEPNPDQIRLLEERALLNDFRMFQDARKSDSHWRRGWRRASDFIKNRALPVGTLLALLVTTPVGHSLTHQQYIERGHQTRVELILDQAGLPHAALRIDDLVYSPSQVTITVQPVRDYFKPEAYGYRSLSTLNLNFSDDQVNKLRARFEKVVWMKYDNNTGSYDCATVVADFLKQETGLTVPVALNASPTLTFAWLASEGAIGNSQIGKRNFIYFSESGWKGIAAKAGHSWISGAEAKLFLTFSPFVAAEQWSIRRENNLFTSTPMAAEADKKRVEEHTLRWKQSEEFQELNLRLKTIEARKVDIGEIRYEELRSEAIKSWTQFATDQSAQILSQAQKEKSQTLAADLRLEAQALNLIKP